MATINLFNGYPFVQLYTEELFRLLDDSGDFTVSGGGTTASASTDDGFRSFVLTGTGITEDPTDPGGLGSGTVTKIEFFDSLGTKIGEIDGLSIDIAAFDAATDAGEAASLAFIQTFFFSSITSILGEDGADEIDTEYHNDNSPFQFDADMSVDLEEGNDILILDSGNHSVFGGVGRDYIDFVGVGDDDADGGNASDLLLMGRGKDVAEGGKGDDLLDGGREADKLFGGKGNDVLYGGRGKDILSGNADADVFVFDEHSGKDKIKDFNLALDSLVFIQSAENEDFTDLNPDDFTFTDTAGGLLITYEGGQVRLVGLTTADAASINYGNGAALAAGVEEVFGFFE